MPAGVTEEKAALRRRLRALPPVDWAPLCQRFLALPQVDRAGTVLLFWGVGREPDTSGILKALLSRGKRLALPRCLPGRQIEARQVTHTACLRPSAYGIPEPGEDCPPVPREEIDLILVPNLCCDRQGYRLGHGGGYYDRYLADYRGRTVALCPEEWVQLRLPTDPFDQPVELVLTQTGQWRGRRFS